MTNVRRMLSDEERAEYDALLYDATHHRDGSRRKSAEVGERFRDLLRDARQAGREWAGWVMDDAMLSGLLKAANRWCKERQVIETPIGERLVTKPAAYGIRRKTADGVMEQLTLGWGEMTEADLDQLIAARTTQILAESDTVTVAKKLKALLVSTGKTPVSEALASLGISLESYLATELAA